MTKKIIITGATGFLGSNVVSELLKENFHVFAIVRPDSNNISKLPVNEKLTIIKSGLLSITDYANTIGDADVFIHMAWDVEKQGRSNVKVQEINIKSSKECLEAAKKLGCKVFLFTGSQAEYGNTQLLTTEESECHPATEYGRAKSEFYKFAQDFCTRSGIKYIHARIFSIYGPGDHKWTLVSSCITHFIRNEIIQLSSCEQNWNFIYVSDCASALVKLINVALRNDCDLGIVNVAGTETRKLKEFVSEMHRLTGFCGGYRLGDEAGYQINPNIGKLCSLTNWQPEISFEKGITEIIKYYKLKES